LLVKGQSEAKTRTVRLSASMTIGRGPECELRVDDAYASQQHARLFAKNNSWFVEDLGSTNGTFVNDQKLAAPAMLQPGDKVRVGQTIMELRR
jgi:pSer/pThr/pTyr-binding forkhead associated (FHA) protein